MAVFKEEIAKNLNLSRSILKGRYEHFFHFFVGSPFFLSLIPPEDIKR